MMEPSPARRRLIRAGAIAGTLLALLLLAGCGASSNDSSSSAAEGEAAAIPDGPIVIGAAVAESGDLAPYDEGPMRAVRVAIDDVNAKGGIAGHDVELVTADTASDPTKGPAAALDVIDKGAAVVIVTCDFDNGSPAAQTAASKNVLASSTCGGSDRFNPNVLGPLVFSMATRAGAEGENMAHWAYEQKGFKTAYLLRDTNIAYAQDMCGGMEKTFPTLDGTSIVGRGTFKGGDQRFTAQISQIRELDPDFVFLCSGTGEGTPFLKQLRGAGLDTPVLAGSAFDGNYWQAAVPKLSNFWFATYASINGDDPRPEVNELFKKMEEQDGKPPVTSFDVTGYALVQAFQKAVEKSNSLDGPALSEALESFKDEPLITGPQTFSDSTHISAARPMAIMAVENGKLEFVEIYPKD
jgi:branched-chain amino acid transport system substrate-binding protein